MLIICAHCHQRFEAPDNGYQDRRRFCTVRCQKAAKNLEAVIRRRNRFTPAMPAMPGIRRTE